MLILLFMFVCVFCKHKYMKYLVFIPNITIQCIALFWMNFSYLLFLLGWFCMFSFLSLPTTNSFLFAFFNRIFLLLWNDIHIELIVNIYLLMHVFWWIKKFPCNFYLWMEWKISYTRIFYELHCIINTPFESRLNAQFQYGTCTSKEMMIFENKINMVAWLSYFLD